MIGVGLLFLRFRSGKDSFKVQELFSEQQDVIVIDCGFIAQSKKEAVEAVFIDHFKSTVRHSDKRCVQRGHVGIIEKEDVTLFASDQRFVWLEWVCTTFLSVWEEQDELGWRGRGWGWGRCLDRR